ncbi:hypothetical protein TRFO_20910 [Tritrichomonas foetus]|uniref:Uncharacterized protein n=1 Tax=Tritrichomonas foetus TaxID=1144522 RepID=A0A1J4KFL7_9EUKA|nr:hypothetical protein TRFO_20910 [Tritrichomonas foetus]|eukprot:OHT10003.1 hypothetical protein TRFO_20910 [Tritrichomonas foetus]
MSSEFTTGSEVAKQIIEDIGLTNEEVLLLHQVSMYSTKGKISSIYLLITDVKLHVISKKKISLKNYKISKSFLWNTLSSIFVNDEKIVFTFNNNKTVSFADNEGITLVSILYQHLNEILLPNHLPNYLSSPSNASNSNTSNNNSNYQISSNNSSAGLPNSSSNNALNKLANNSNNNLNNNNGLPILLFDKSILKPQALSQNVFTKRLDFIMALSNRPFPPSFRDFATRIFNLSKILSINEITFSLKALLPFQNLFNVIFYSLFNEQRLSKIILPLTANPSWSAFGDLCFYNSSIKEIESTEEINDDFKIFVDKISSNKENSLVKVKFSNSKYDLRFINDLTSLIQRNPNLIDISIENELIPEAMEAFLNNFETCVEYKHIVVLGLNQNSNVNYQKLLTLTPNLKSLDLSNCGLDISDVFKHIVLSDSNLEVINLSSNKFLTEFDENMKLKPNLTKFIMRSIEWDFLNLNNFLTVISKNQNEENNNSKLYLDLSTMKHPPNSTISHLYSVIRNYKLTNLDTFIFDFNNIDQNIINFLASCDSLKSLSFSNCFNSYDEYFRSFLNYLKNNKKLVELVLRAKNLTFTLDMLKNLAETLIANENIEILDLQGHKQGDYICDVISEILSENITLKEVRLDGNSIESLIPYETLETKLLLRNQQFILQLPIKDFNQLIVSQKVTEQDVLKTVNLARRLQRPTSRKNVQTFQSSIPEDIHCQMPSINYSNYIKKDAIWFMKVNDDENTPKFNFDGVYNKYVDDTAWFGQFEVCQKNNEHFEKGEKTISTIDNEITLERLMAAVLP